MKSLILLVSALFLCTSAASVELPQQQATHNIKTVNHAFAPGEKLTYEISWSNIVQAGVAVMEIREGERDKNEKTFEFVSQTHSVGVVEAFYPVRDVVESTVDAEGLFSDRFVLRESHGGRKRSRDMVFDHDNNTVRVTKNGNVETYPVPERVQDALSSLYYVRTRPDLVVGKPIVIDVHDSDKTWSVEIKTLGKEKVTTPAGEFETIKIKTYPKYEGVFMHKGEIFIWLTDDARRVPVLMKSEISIGSIVATLVVLQEGGNQP